jgi:hypothetical protein
MLQDFGGQTPLRITEAPCLLRKHRSLSAEVFKKPSVGGAANCPACHTTAAQGGDDDGNARVALGEARRQSRSAPQRSC